VIDNTFYPEALKDSSWDWSSHARNLVHDSANDVYVQVKFETTFKSNDKYFRWTFVFIIILIVLGFLFLMSLLFYCRQSYVYASKAKERKYIKQELMKIKDTEYTNFLIGENESLKKVKTSGGLNVIKSLNDSNNEDEDELDNSD
jgi:predicted membrane protein